MIFIDALSRVQFHHKLKHLEKFMKKREKDMYEFLRFHATVDYTADNYLKFYFGDFNSTIY